MNNVLYFMLLSKHHERKKTAYKKVHLERILIKYMNENLESKKD